MSDPTATITTPADGMLAVCLACNAELRTDWPGTLDAFRTWHRQHCGGSNTRTDTRPDLVKSGDKSGPAQRELPGPWPTPTSEVKA